MTENKKSREELLNEIEELKSKLAEVENGVSMDGEENSEELMNGLLSGLLQGSNFDLNTVQLDYINVMINNIPNPVYVMDADGSYIGCNEQYSNFIGLPVNEIVGQKMSDLFPEEISKPEAEKDKQLLENGGLMNYESQLMEEDGTKWDLVFSKSVFKNFDGSTAGVICVINDITEKREAERALIESEKKLREANATKDKFFSIISHDLRSPFVSLLGMSELLVNDYHAMEEEYRKTFIKDMYDSIHKAYELMQNLLEWSNVQKGKLEFKPAEFKVNEVINEAVVLEKANARQRNITITYKPKEEATVYADRNMTASTIRNLISNAIKYNKENGSTDITVSQSDKFTKVCVKDSGIGIDEHNMDKLFRIDISHKSIGASRANKGSGLGLILCKEFIERNGGQITFESEVGKGSTFCIELPINSQE